MDPILVGKATTTETSGSVYLLPKYGIQSELVDGGDLAQWEKALSRPTQAVLSMRWSRPSPRR